VGNKEWVLFIGKWWEQLFC